MALLAEGILKLHWDQTIPVNLAHIVKSMGVALKLHDGLRSSACLRISHNNRAYLLLSRSLLNMYQRYAVAHALGHVALHHLRPGMQRDIHVSRDFRVDFTQAHNLEANEFALRLLMPDAALRYAVEHMRANTMEELEHVFAAPAVLLQQRLMDLDLSLPRSASHAVHHRRQRKHTAAIQDITSA